MTDEGNYVITNDKWMRLSGGKLDPADREVIKAAGKDAIIIDTEQLLDIMAKDEPEKYAALHKEMEKQAGKQLTVEEFEAYCAQANETFKQFEATVMMMPDTAARMIRVLRVDRHYSWRAIGRAVLNDSNQLLGMALAQRAAVMCGEDYRLDPWN